MFAICVLGILKDCIVIPILMGIFTTLFGWYITTIRMGPKLEIGDVEHDSDGTPFIKIWNKSRCFNAYKVEIYITYRPKFRNANGIQTEYKRSQKTGVIEKNSNYSIVLTTNESDCKKRTKEKGKNIDVKIHVLGYNRYGVATTNNVKRELKRIKVFEQ